MATYPLIFSPSFSYEDHLMYNDYIADINKGIIKASKKNSTAISKSIESNIKFLSDTISSENQLIRSDIHSFQESMENELSDISNGIADLRADFDIAMGKVLSQFEMMRTEIQSGFERIVNVLENFRRAEAHEHFRMAIDYYRDGCRFVDKSQWMEDALKHFLISTDIYSRNPFAHFYIGHIYHYQKEHLNFENALQHYNLCSMYGEAEPGYSFLVAQSYFYSGWLHAIVSQDYDKAINLTQKAIQLDPNLCESYYHLAKFYSILNDPLSAIKNLEILISKFDRNYLLKTGLDPDFDPIRDEVNEFMIRLRNSAKNKFSGVYAPVSLNFDPMDVNWTIKLNESEKKVKEILRKDKYFTYLDNMDLAHEYVKLYREALRSYKDNYERAVQNINALEEFVLTHKCISGPEIERTKNKLYKAKEKLTKRDHRIHNIAKNLVKEFISGINVGNPLQSLDSNMLDKFLDTLEFGQNKSITVKEGTKTFPWNYYWFNSHDFQWLTTKLIERKNYIVEERIKNSLCIKCGINLGFFTVLKRKKICKKCEKYK